MIFLPILAMAVYAFYGIPPVAPLVPVTASERSSPQPRRRENTVQTPPRNTTSTRRTNRDSGRQSGTSPPPISSRSGSPPASGSHRPRIPKSRVEHQEGAAISAAIVPQSQNSATQTKYPLSQSRQDASLETPVGNVTGRVVMPKQNPMATDESSQTPQQLNAQTSATYRICQDTQTETPVSPGHSTDAQGSADPAGHVQMLPVPQEPVDAQRSQDTQTDAASDPVPESRLDHLQRAASSLATVQPSQDSTTQTPPLLPPSRQDASTETPMTEDIGQPIPPSPEQSIAEEGTKAVLLTAAHDPVPEGSTESAKLVQNLPTPEDPIAAGQDRRFQGSEPRNPASVVDTDAIKLTRTLPPQPPQIRDAAPTVKPTPCSPGQTSPRHAASPSSQPAGFPAKVSHEIGSAELQTNSSTGQPGSPELQTNSSTGQPSAPKLQTGSPTGEPGSPKLQRFFSTQQSGSPKLQTCSSTGQPRTVTPRTTRTSVLRAARISETQNGMDGSHVEASKNSRSSRKDDQDTNEIEERKVQRAKSCTAESTAQDTTYNPVTPRTTKATVLRAAKISETHFDHDRIRSTSPTKVKPSPETTHSLVTTRATKTSVLRKAIISKTYSGKDDSNTTSPVKDKTKKETCRSPEPIRTTKSCILRMAKISETYFENDRSKGTCPAEGTPEPSKANVLGSVKNKHVSHPVEGIPTVQAESPRNVTSLTGGTKPKSSHGIASHRTTRTSRLRMAKRFDTSSKDDPSKATSPITLGERSNPSHETFKPTTTRTCILRMLNIAATYFNDNGSKTNSPTEGSQNKVKLKSSHDRVQTTLVPVEGEDKVDQLVAVDQEITGTNSETDQIGYPPSDGKFSSSMLSNIVKAILLSEKSEENGSNPVEAESKQVGSPSLGEKSTSADSHSGRTASTSPQRTFTVPTLSHIAIASLLYLKYGETGKYPVEAESNPAERVTPAAKTDQTISPKQKRKVAEAVEIDQKISSGHEEKDTLAESDQISSLRPDEYSESTLNGSSSQMGDVHVDAGSIRIGPSNTQEENADDPESSRKGEDPAFADADPVLTVEPIAEISGIKSTVCVASGPPEKYPGVLPDRNNLPPQDTETTTRRPFI